MDSNELNDKLQEDIQKVTNYLQEIANFRYYLLIYKLIKGGHIKIGVLAELSGYSTENIYRIVATFDSKEGIEKEDSKPESLQ